MIDQGETIRGNTYFGVVFQENKKRRLYRGQPPFVEDFMKKVTTHVSMGGQR